MHYHLSRGALYEPHFPERVLLQWLEALLNNLGYLFWWVVQTHFWERPDMPVPCNICGLIWKILFLCISVKVWPTIPNVINNRKMLPALTESIKSYQPPMFPFCKHSTVFSLFPLQTETIFLCISRVKHQSTTMSLQVQINNYSSCHGVNVWLLWALSWLEILQQSQTVLICILMEPAVPEESQSCHLLR